jgi:hypothetical protein
MIYSVTVVLSPFQLYQIASSTTSSMGHFGCANRLEELQFLQRTSSPLGWVGAEGTFDPHDGKEIVVELFQAQEQLSSCVDASQSLHHTILHPIGIKSVQWRRHTSVQLHQADDVLSPVCLPRPSACHLSAV